MSNFYITTPIYYVNDVPHLGHAYCTMVADALARFHRLRGDDTRFLTGTDEHGQKIEAAATKRGLTPQQLVDEVAPRFDETWKSLGITNDAFIRTTSQHHKNVVASLWRRIRERNPDDLFLETYQGWYCVGCEAFYTESQLEKDGDTFICAVHKTPVTWLDKERSWFFRLSKYEQPLLDHIAANPDFIKPESYKNEIVSFLKSGLKDLSVSRTSFAWGISPPEHDPEDKAHVIYVWMDALTNYLSYLAPADGLDGPDVQKYWPQSHHLIGKDILRFHAVYWPAFLLAAGLPPPRQIFATGWWTVRGQKIAKSMPATRIDPLALADALGAGSSFGRAIGIDAMRYYLMREMPLGNDGDFTFESLFARFNADLANDLGNLINRALTMLTKFAPAVDAPPVTNAHVAALADSASETCSAAAAHFELFQPSRALESIWRFVGAANRFIDQTQPWMMAKANDPALPHVQWALQSSLWIIARLIAPVLPETSRILRELLGDAGDIGWPTGALADAPALAPRAPTPIFPRLDDKAQAAIVEKVLPALLAPAEAPPAAAPVAEVDDAALPLIQFADFEKLELRVGLVVAAAAIPKKDKLLNLTVDLGEAQPRTIVSGLAGTYKPEQLVGKRVIVVANLAPRKYGKLESQGMILAAGASQILGLSSVDPDVPPGTRVR